MARKIETIELTTEEIEALSMARDILIDLDIDIDDTYYFLDGVADYYNRGVNGYGNTSFWEDRVIREDKE